MRVAPLVLIVGCTADGAKAPASSSAASVAASVPAPSVAGTSVAVTLGSGSRLFVGSAASHACLRSEEGALFCWGNNDHGQLGRPSDDPEPQHAKRVPLREKVVSAALGETHTCALLTSGAVRCFGADATGTVSPETAVSSLRDVVSLVAGVGFTCARSADLSVRCWGGVPGTSEVARAPTEIAGLRATTIATSSKTLCGVTPERHVLCLGENADGRFAPAGPAMLTAPTRVQISVGPLDGAPAQPASDAFAVSDVGLCGLLGDVSRCYVAERELSSIHAASAVSAGADGLTCTLQDVRLICDRLPSREWLAFRTEGEFRQVAVGRGFFCALPKGEGPPVCWGTNDKGQLGASPPTRRARPITIEALAGVTQIAAGRGVVCGVSTEKKMICVGADGQTVERWSPHGTTRQPIRDDAARAITRVDAIAVGGGVRCGLTDGLATCWGDNQANQIISVDPGWVDVPTTLASLGKHERLLLGPAHACSVASDKSIRCWGGAGKARFAPATPKGLPAAVDVAVGTRRACALLDDGSVSCYSLEGADALEARRVSGARGWTSIAAGGRHFCGVTASKTVACFGDNEAGQLGVAGSPAAPEVVRGVEAVKAVALGEAFTCALLEDGTVRCFGSNAAGVLGGGQPAKGGSEPVRIEGLSDVVQIAASPDAVSVLTRTGDVLAWGGEGFFAEVGDDIASSKDPVPIRLPQGAAPPASRDGGEAK
jgi:alpha-tubulin suppressor-like RCC1 family protein